MFYGYHDSRNVHDVSDLFRVYFFKAFILLKVCACDHRTVYGLFQCAGSQGLQPWLMVIARADLRGGTASIPVGVSFSVGVEHILSKLSKASESINAHGLELLRMMSGDNRYRCMLRSF